MIDVSLSIVKLVELTSPKLTPVAAVNPVPVIVTASPPAVDPSAGSRPVTTGRAGATVVVVVEVVVVLLVVVVDVDVVVVEVLVVVDELVVVVVVVVGSLGSRTGPTGAADCVLDPAAFSARTETRISRPRSSSPGENRSELPPTSRQSLGASAAQLLHENT